LSLVKDDPCRLFFPPSWPRWEQPQPPTCWENRTPVKCVPLIVFQITVNKYNLTLTTAYGTEIAINDGPPLNLVLLNFPIFHPRSTPFKPPILPGHFTIRRLRV